MHLPSPFTVAAMMDVIPDEDFDRLWDEAVEEAAAKKSIAKQRKSHGSNREVDKLPKLSKSSRSSNHPPKQSNRIRQQLPSQSDESHSSRPVHKPLEPAVVTDAESKSKITDSSSNSVPRQRSLTRSNSIESSSREMPRRRSSISRVPSLPSLGDMSKHNMYGREDLSALSYLSPLELPGGRTRSMDESVTSLFSGFSEFESVSTQEQSHASETRRKRITKTRSKSRSPTRGAKKQQSNGDAQQEAAKYILEAEPSERLLFEIPATFEVKGHKDNRNQSTGLVLSYGKGKNETGTVMVKEISPTSLFASTRLKSGHEILMINSHRVKCPQQAAKIMKSLGGDVTMYVSEGTRAPGMKYVRVKVGSEKKMNGSTSRSTASSSSKSSAMSMEDTIDRSLRSAAKDVTLVTQSGLVRVARVDPHGAFRKNLKVGDVVITVNGTLVADEEEAKEQLLDTVNDEVMCMLIYSMADLCKGLINQLLPGWKSSWASEVEVTLSRDDVSFSVVWRDDWVCECNHSDEEAVYDSYIQPALEKMNWATSLVINSLVEASGVKYKQSALDVDCNTCTATSGPTSEESTGSNDESGGPAGCEPKESRQKSDPSIEAHTDDDDVSGESRHAPTEILQESTKSERPSVEPGKSLYFELHGGDDDSSYEQC